MNAMMCRIAIHSEYELEMVARLIEAKLFSGITFVGREQRIYDEVPAVFTEHEILGMRIVLQGSGLSEPYYLEMHSTGSMQEPLTVIDISKYICQCLKGIHGITVSVTRSTD